MQFYPGIQVSRVPESTAANLCSKPFRCSFEFSLSMFMMIACLCPQPTRLSKSIALVSRQMTAGVNSKQTRGALGHLLEVSREVSRIN